MKSKHCIHKKKKKKLGFMLKIYSNLITPPHTHASILNTQLNAHMHTQARFPVRIASQHFEVRVKNEDNDLFLKQFVKRVKKNNYQFCFQ